MTARELIAQLENVPGDSKVFMAYDGNIVVTEPANVDYMTFQNRIGNCWWGVKIGDTVILCVK
jgi:hypothetical protein